MKPLLLLTAALSISSCSLQINADGSKSATVDGAAVQAVAAAIIATK